MTASRNILTASASQGSRLPLADSLPCIIPDDTWKISISPLEKVVT